MTRFCEMGVELQMNSNSYWQAKKRFCNSCILCADKPNRPECRVCPVREAFLTNVEIFDKKIPDSERNFIQAERELL